MRLRSPARLAVLAMSLIAVLALGWWGHGVLKKRELQSSILALVTDASAHATDALQLREPDAAGLERLEGHFRALEEASTRFTGLQTWRDSALSSAAQRYVDEVHALLRRKLAAHRGAAAVRVSAAAIATHLRSPRGRSGAWIDQAVALKQAMEREYFEYRLAAGGLEKSWQTLREARSALAPRVAPLPLLDERALAEARQRQAEDARAIAQLVEAARKLPEPR